MNDLARIVLLMYPQIPAESEMPAALLKALEGNPVFVPSHWGTSERDRRPWSSREVLEEIAENSESFEIFLSRQTAVKYSGYFDFANLPFLKFDFKSSFPKTRWPDLLELADRIAAAVKPRFGILHIFRTTPDRWSTDQDRLLRWMSLAAYAVPVQFRSNGPLGLGMRTYFGHDILAMAGRQSLLASPARAQELDWGGVRIDLADDLWALDQGELAERWKKRMDDLNPQHLFAEPIFEDDNRTVSFRPAQAWLDRRKNPIPPKAGV